MSSAPTSPRSSRGDFVVLNWRAVCGHCRACAKGTPQYCFATHNASQPMTLTDGTPLSPALGIGAFAEKTLVAAGQCTKIDPQAPATAAGLLGCGVMAGFAAAVNTGGVGRGDSIAVIGCGGVGNAAIAGATLAGATTIIAVDVDDRKLEWAKDFGATHTVNSREEDAVPGRRGACHPQRPHGEDQSARRRAGTGHPVGHTRRRGDRRVWTSDSADM